MAKAKGQAVQIWHYFLKGGLATLNSELHNSCIYQQPILVTQVILQPNYAIASFPPNNVKFRTLGHLIFNKSDMRWILRCYVWWFDDSNWGSHMFSRPEGWESLDFTNSGRNTHTHIHTRARAQSAELSSSLGSTRREPIQSQSAKVKPKYVEVDE